MVNGTAVVHINAAVDKKPNWKFYSITSQDEVYVKSVYAYFDSVHNYCIMLNKHCLNPHGSRILVSQLMKTKHE